VFARAHIEVQIKDIAMGLQYLHVEIKMIHGDLKDVRMRISIDYRQLKSPFQTNVLIAQDGTARLTDFDVALFIINTTQNQELNVGTTHAYSAIEICIGTNWDDDAFKPTEPTDMWAFGVLMFEVRSLQTHPTLSMSDFS
jgi:serine/threonine protein kinase